MLAQRLSGLDRAGGVGFGRREEEAPAADVPQAVDRLAAHIRTCYESARRAKQENGVSERLLASFRQYRGQYSAEDEALIEQGGGTKVFRRLTRAKADSLASWVDEALTTSLESPWSISPTPLPSLPEELVSAVSRQAEGELWDFLSGIPPEVAATTTVEELQEVVRERAAAIRDETMRNLEDEATDRCRRMQEAMEDKLTEGGFEEALSDWLLIFSIFPTAILKGPVVVRTRKLTWAYRSPVPQVTSQETLQWYCVSPFDLFPAPGARTLDDDYVIERRRIPVRELQELIGVPTYSEDAIREVLRRAPSTVEKVSDPATDDERDDLETRGGHESQREVSDAVTALDFWGSVQGSVLADWGMPVEDPDRYYEVNAIVVGGRAIRCLVNPDPLGRRPYSADSFKPIPNSFWGEGLPEVIADLQRAANACFRGACDNAALAAGFQVGVDVAQLPANYEVTSIRPYAVHQFDSTATGGRGEPLKFWQPAMHVVPLTQWSDQLAREAGDASGVPDYTQGSPEVAGAGRTASGFAMLQNNAGRTLRKILGSIGRRVFKTTLERLYAWIMLNDDDESLKGDAQIVVQGPLAAMSREQVETRQRQWLAETTNPVDLEIIGLEKRANVLRSVGSRLGLPAEDVVPSAEELAERAQMAAMLPPPPEPAGPEEGTNSGTPGAPAKAAATEGK